MTGWRIVAAAAVIVAAMVAAVLSIEGTGDTGVRAALRATAATSLGLFLAAFAASSLNALLKNRATKWLLRNRRYIGLAFATSHFVHLGLIAARATGHTETFWATRTVASLIPGATAYLFITAMTITSFDGPTRALGRRNWKILHKTGSYVIIAIFLGATIGGPNLAALTAIALTLALRFYVRTRAIFTK